MPDYVNNAITTVKNRAENATIKNITINSTPKTKAGNRIIPLTPRAFEALKIMESYNPQHSPKDFVLKSVGGYDLTRTNLSKMFKRMQKNAGTTVQDAGLHSLRHASASLLIRKNVDIKVISALLGHAKVTTTVNLPYGHTYQSSRYSKKHDVTILSIL